MRAVVDDTAIDRREKIATRIDGLIDAPLVAGVIVAGIEVRTE